MGVNKRSMDIQALRVATTSESVNPLTCIDKAAELLETFGASRPNAVTVRALLRRLDNFSSASLAEQRAVRTAVKGLKLKLERALEVRAEQADEDDGNDPATPSTPVAPAAPTAPVFVLGVDSLPPNERDPSFWDEAAFDKGRRCQFALSVGLGFGTDFTRSDFLAHLVPDPEVTFQRLCRRGDRFFQWHSRDEVDELFAKDRAEIDRLMAEYGLDLEQFETSLQQPFLEFRPRGECPFDVPYDSKAHKYPELCLTKAGELRAKLNFIQDWPRRRPTHRGQSL